MMPAKTFKRLPISTKIKPETKWLNIVNKNLFADMSVFLHNM